MSVLLIAEHNNKELKPFTLNAATAASQIDNDVHALLLVKLWRSCKSTFRITINKKVIQVEAAYYENFVAENFAPVIVN